MTVTKIYGPPGCGKTETLIRRMEEALDSGVLPNQIGFCSFSRRGVQVARDRAADRFGLEPKQMEHMRTLHATAFRGLGIKTEDVLSHADYTALGRMLGEQFSQNAKPDDGIIVNRAVSMGNRYLAIIERSRQREVSLEEEWKWHDTYNMSFAKCRQIRDQLDEYKSTYHKMDFTDMIEKWIEIGEPPNLKLFILDEAQDLSPLQWRMARKISDHSEDTVIAGDDDQAIHEWNGASAKQFIDFEGESRVLTQSYRVPRSAYSMARRVVQRIKDRVPKIYEPTSNPGRVGYYYRIEDIDLGEGSWTILARTNKLADQIAKSVRRLGYYYSIRGHAPITPKQAQAIQTWRRLTRGESVELALIKDLYEQVPKQGDKAVVRRGSSKLLEALDPEDSLTIQDLMSDYGLLVNVSLFGEISRNEFDILNLGKDMEAYLRGIEAAGEDLTQPPRIKISTIHASKGDEDDNVVVYTEVTATIAKKANQDEEHRLFYVAVTRTRDRLCIIDPPAVIGTYRTRKYDL